jgi:hypothetical protein
MLPMKADPQRSRTRSFLLFGVGFAAVLCTVAGVVSFAAKVREAVDRMH